MISCAKLKFFRYKGKRYTFKIPIELDVREVPDSTQDDEDDRGEFVVENDEWGIRGSDRRSLENAVIDAEFYFHLDYGPYMDHDNKDLELAKLMREYPGLKMKEVKEKRNEIIKARCEIKEKLDGIIESITDDGSVPWDDNEFFKDG
jgi:hypothetical protein